VQEPVLAIAARRRSQQRRLLWPAVLLSPDRAAELLAVLAHDCSGRLQSKPTAPRSSMKMHSAAIRLTASSGVNIDAIAITSHGRYSTFSAYC
jgi:hypothetical protein